MDILLVEYYTLHVTDEVFPAETETLTALPHKKLTALHAFTLCVPFATLVKVATPFEPVLADLGIILESQSNHTVTPFFNSFKRSPLTVTFIVPVVVAASTGVRVAVNSDNNSTNPSIFSFDSSCNYWKWYASRMINFTVDVLCSRVLKHSGLYT